MATNPYFVLSPNTALSIIGLIHGPDKTVPTPAEDWRQAKVDVIIPALNEEANIHFCLAGLAGQTMKPRKIMLVDDGSSDRTIEYARDFCALNGMEIEIIQRRAPIGKTPTIKRQARELDSDVEFILDSDTVLESPNYIERTVEELYQAVGIASACGNVYSLRRRDRQRLTSLPALAKFLAKHPEAPMVPKQNFLVRFLASLTSLYREILYVFLQKFVYRGQMTFFGSIIHPVGCAAAYRRKYVKDLFDRYEPILGDDLTNSEDIFIGFALLDKGYRNIQLDDVYCRSQEPGFRKVPRQLYMWASSFIQSCYYFNSLTTSPFRSLKRWRHQRAMKRSRAGQEILEKRKIQEPYRQPFGEQFTREFGRPIGWAVFLSAVEKIFFPGALLVMLILGWWEVLVVTILAETAVSLVIMAFVAPRGRRLELMAKGILIAPIRYFSLFYDLLTSLRFAIDVWIKKDRRWRK